MILTRACFAWLLLALWPVAMLHCDMEAAGIEVPMLVHQGHDIDDHNAHGHGHSGEPWSASMHPSEDLGLQSAGAGIKVRCPELWLVAGQSPLVLCACERQAAAPPPRAGEPCLWLKNWRFEQRAALPARAPGVCM